MAVRRVGTSLRTLGRCTPHRYFPTLPTQRYGYWRHICTVCTYADDLCRPWQAVCMCRTHHIHLCNLHTHSQVQYCTRRFPIIPLLLLLTFSPRPTLPSGNHMCDVNHDPNLKRPSRVDLMIREGSQSRPSTRVLVNPCPGCPLPVPSTLHPRRRGTASLT